MVANVLSCYSLLLRIIKAYKLMFLRLLAKQTCRELSLPECHQSHMPKTQGAGRLIRQYIWRPLIRDEVTTVQQLASSRHTSLNKILYCSFNYSEEQIL